MKKIALLSIIINSYCFTYSQSVLVEDTAYDLKFLQTYYVGSNDSLFNTVLVVPENKTWVVVATDGNALVSTADFTLTPTKTRNGYSVGTYANKNQEGNSVILTLPVYFKEGTKLWFYCSKGEFITMEEYLN